MNCPQPSRPIPDIKKLHPGEPDFAVVTSSIRQKADTHHAIQRLQQQYLRVRSETEQLVKSLTEADATTQSMPDASPAKWHLGHTTWFFETLVLKPTSIQYQRFNEAYLELFNSYYESIGKQHVRAQRGLLSRPSLVEVFEYRQHVDAAMVSMLDTAPVSSELLSLVELGCHHERQHQELILTDILHLFASNPLRPQYQQSIEPQTSSPITALQFVAQHGGVVDIGHSGADFAFDCEQPRHSVFLQPYRLANRPICNQEWLDFMTDGGYKSPLLWLADGWHCAVQQGWHSPLYWEQRDNEWWQMTLNGMQPVNPSAPVCHISYYEADAYARWAQCRLPTEFEWEHSASTQSLQGHFAEQRHFQPLPTRTPSDGFMQLFGDVWEWTSSPFMAYPRFKPFLGSAGEYNGKFMSGQYVLRGGACTSAMDHIRVTYRNFFPPAARWQFSGIRLAQDC